MEKPQVHVSLKFNKKIKELISQGKRIVSLGLGEPNFETPNEIIEDTYFAMKRGFNRYSNPYGLIELRKLIKKYLKREKNINVGLKNIIITSGSKQASFLTFLSLLEPNDEIISLTPCYNNYSPQIKMVEPTAKIINIDLIKDTFDIDFMAIENSISKNTKLIILNSPHNPTGKVLSIDEIQKIAQIATKHDLYVLSDEVGEDLVFDMKHISIASLKGMKARTIIVNSFSKTFSMSGWRIGYLIADEGLTKTISEIQKIVNNNVCTFIQKGACSVFSLDKTYLEDYKKMLMINKKILLTMVKNNNKLSLTGGGGCFAFLNILKTGIDSDNFSTRLLEEKNVATNPGKIFGNKWDDHIRISLLSENKCFIKGISLIDEFVRELK
jgi:aspartate/methionine/tyrosine aminotransferase